MAVMLADGGEGQHRRSTRWHHAPGNAGGGTPPRTTSRSATWLSGKSPTPFALAPGPVPRRRSRLLPNVVGKPTVRARPARPRRAVLRRVHHDGRGAGSDSRPPALAWAPAVDTGRSLHDGADVAELTGLLPGLPAAGWPAGMRVIVRRQRPHPGAELRFTDIDGYRFQTFVTGTGAGLPHRTPQLTPRRPNVAVGVPVPPILLVHRLTAHRRARRCRTTTAQARANAATLSRSETCTPCSGDNGSNTGPSNPCHGKGHIRADPRRAAIAIGVGRCRTTTALTMSTIKVASAIIAQAIQL
jgi:hypothetical protein